MADNKQEENKIPERGDSTTLEIICNEEKNTVMLMSRVGIRKLGQYIIKNDNIDYDHLDPDIYYSIGNLVGEDGLECLDPENFKNDNNIVLSKIGNNPKIGVVYFVFGKPKYFVEFKGRKTKIMS